MLWPHGNEKRYYLHQSLDQLFLIYFPELSDGGALVPLNISGCDCPGLTVGLDSRVGGQLGGPGAVLEKKGSSQGGLKQGSGLEVLWRLGSVGVRWDKHG